VTSCRERYAASACIIPLYPPSCRVTIVPVRFAGPIMSTVAASTTPGGGATHLLCRSRRRCGVHRSGASSRASYSGAGGPPGRPGGGGLILPGQDDFPADWAQQQQGGGRPTPPGRPGGGPRGQPGFGPSGGPSVTPKDGPLYQPFRPPAAYTDAATLGKEELVNKLRGAPLSTSSSHPSLGARLATPVVNCAAFPTSCACLVTSHR